MSFFDEYKKREEQRRQDGDTGGTFLSSEEKKVLIDEGVEFIVTGVERDDENKFGKRYVVTLELEGETRKAGFGRGTVFSRDRMLEYIQEMLEAGAEPPTMKLEMNGRSQVLVEA